MVVEILGTLLLALVTAVVGYLTLTLKNFLKNKRVVAFLDRVRTEHEWLYDAAVKFALVAEEHVSDLSTNFSENDRYEFIRDKVLRELKNLSERTGIPISVSSDQLDAMVRKAILAAQKTYEESMSAAPNRTQIPSDGNLPDDEKVPGGTTVRKAANKAKKVL
jgi:hypothetical protein